MRERKLDKRRLGRCYELAAHRLLDRFEDDSSARLVHGTFEDYPYPAIPHTWIEYVVEDANVYDDKFEKYWMAGMGAGEQPELSGYGFLGHARRDRPQQLHLPPNLHRIVRDEALRPVGR